MARGCSYPLPRPRARSICGLSLFLTVVLTVYILNNDDAIGKDLGVETDQERRRPSQSLSLLHLTRERSMRRARSSSRGSEMH